MRLSGLPTPLPWLLLFSPSSGDHSVSTTRRSFGSASIRARSSAVSSSSSAARFSRLRSGLDVFGTAETRSCPISQASVTWAGVAPWAAAISAITGSSSAAPLTSGR